MERSKPSSQSNGRDTFLSRVFGLQSDDVTTSIHTDELSQFRERDEHSDTQLSGAHAGVESESSGEDEEEVRVPESDQGTTSEEDAEVEREDAVIPEEEPATEDVALNDESEMPSFHFKKADDSLPKVGQLSSEEERDGGSEAIKDEDEDEADEDIPLFSKDGLTNPKQSQQSLHQNHSLLFQRILKHNKQKSQKQRLFTSSKDTNNRSIPRDLEAQNGNSSTGQGDGGGFRAMQNSFISKGDRLGKKIFRPGGFNLKRPNILNNISVLNSTPVNRLHSLSPKERALWKWANVENLDIFLQDVYNYYLGSGYFCMVLLKVLNLATLTFVVLISTYMGYCIDYSKVPHTHAFSEITIDKCYRNNIAGFTKFFLWVFYIFVVLKVVQLYFDIQNLNEIHSFYTYLLNISDKELQSIPWQNVIQQIIFLKDQNALTANVVEVKAKNRIDAHDVANRIMRKENYLIALYNNDVLDLSLPIPLYRTSPLTKTLEWNINLCIMGYAFNESGFLKQSFLKPSQHEYVKEELQKRFMLAGFLNIILSPFLVSYFVLLYFFRYFNEYKTSPGSLGARQYTPMAEWKFREYNELYHLFQKRIGLSTFLADRYIDQFPKEGINLMLRFVAFVTGSFVAILGLFTILDPENFLNFEITHDKTALFYITVLGTIWTVCRSSISDEYNVFDPDETIQELASYTHYLPSEWEGRYHTEEVKNEFCNLYNLKIVILLRELASLIMTPFILWFSLPRSADRIVEFFRDNSVYVDGLGYVCKYAMFEINDSIDAKTRRRKSSRKDSRNTRSSTEISDISSGRRPSNQEDATAGVFESDGSEVENEDREFAVNKMMQSYMYFMDDYENSENALGKHQLPHKKYEESSDGARNLSNSYSWKKQFRPGQRPELFRIGKHALEVNKPLKRNLKGISDTPARRRKKKGNQINDDLNKDVEESFISSVPLQHYDLPNNEMSGDNARTTGGGVLGLVKEYYRKSDIGR
ncbi:autophagy protein atg9 [Zygosaccharomyces mellis]|uniref:Autophagy-related protein 9 n=1 Tax=Zygosaccharomyces mellis TaxID=42258 RepID=A0A4C2E9F2_9SACH|nr:autophagy protein atg9 [Zygosaccharomyces mellis]